MQKPVIFKSRNFELSGMLHLPYRIRENDPVPVVVFCHGFTGNKIEAHRIFVYMARELEKNRIAALRFDFSGCGDSSGNFIYTTFRDEVNDTINAVDFVCGQRGIDKKRIGILGLSLGGAVAAYAAGKDSRIKSMALWAPAADLLEEDEQIKTDEEIRDIRRLKAVDYYGTLIGRKFIEDIPKVKPVLALKNFKGATIILHGSNDDSVPLEHSERYYDYLKKKKLKVERHIIEDSDHVFSSYAWQKDVLNRTLRFFIKTL